MPYFLRYKAWVLADLLAAGLTTVNELVLPMIIRQLTNTGLNNIADVTANLIIKTSLLYAGLKVLDIFANAFMQYFGHMVGAKIENDMRKDLFAHLQYLDPQFYSENKIGQLMARITSDLTAVTEFAHHTPEEYFKAAIMFVVSFVILINIHVKLTIVLFLAVPIMFVSVNTVNKKYRRAAYDRRSQIGVINSSVEDSLLGIDVVQSFTNEEYEIEKFNKDSLTFYNIQSMFYKSMAQFHSITRSFDGLMYIIVISYGGYLMMKGQIQPGDLFAYILYVNILTATIRRVVDFTEQFHMGMTGIEKFVEVMDEKPVIYDLPGSIELDHIVGDIKLNNVTFSYDPEEEIVLDNISLDIPHGKNTAIVGPSGGGKSTIINLIPRFYDVDKGSITLDGINIKDIKLHSLRDKIGIVQQNVYLFSDSIYENIRYGKPDATEEEVIEAARLAGADEFIQELPYGYDTHVGERGVRLSGGQRQRISIARVFLKNPPILILDEATSALDNESEQYVQESLEKLSRGRTTITIAHRLSTIMDADNIVVITKNGIKEQGTHRELLDNEGLYASFYAMGIQSFDGDY